MSEGWVIEERDRIYYARGDTYEIREQLKDLGFGWNRTEQAWLTARWDAALEATNLPGFRRAE